MFLYYLFFSEVSIKFVKKFIEMSFLKAFLQRPKVAVLAGGELKTFLIGSSGSVRKPNILLEFWSRPLRKF